MSAPATGQEAPGIPLPPGYRSLQFHLPPPGSYRLPPIMPAGDGAVLDTTGTPRRLHETMGDKLVLMAFVYATCTDLAGCPLALHVFHQLQRKLAVEPRLAQHLRLVVLSFDPVQDTPQNLAAYAARQTRDALEWRFLTTASDQDLRPILGAYDQDARRVYDAQGTDSGTYSHILRVYLVDRRRQVRNIYTVSFLHADILLNDVRTLLMEEREGTTRPEPAAGTRPGPGDVRAGYEPAGSATDSAALHLQRGAAADLMALVKHPPLGLPPLSVPDDNPPTPQKIALGRKLFYDRRLSLNDTQSCAMCHIPGQGFTSNQISTAVGIEGRTVRRNAPTVFNSAYLTRLFHDGRETSLEQQIWGPLLARNEMGNPSPGFLIEKIRNLPDYAGRFEAAFGRPVTMETLGMALASYQRALDAADSPFDRWRYGNDPKALSAEARAGFLLFTGKAGCAACHTVGTDHALFTDQAFHNTGIGYRQAMEKPPAARPVQLAPGLVVPLDPAVIESVSEPRPGDLGRYEITLDPADRWKYRTPTLRNVALTAPYMHDGSLRSLEEVVDFYDRGGEPNDNLDPLLRPLGLDPEEKRQLVVFLRSLTGSNVPELVADGQAAPVGDVGQED